MGAHYEKIGITFCFFCYISDAESTNVIVTARRHKQCVEVAQTDGTIVLEGFALNGVIGWEVVSDLDAFFIDFCLYSHFVSLSNVSISKYLVC